MTRAHARVTIDASTALQGGVAMTLLTILASTDIDDEQACLSCAGLVDRHTAAAEDVALWSDPETLNQVQAAAAARVQSRVA
jgi:hypothetical protein